jgi:ubiquinone/menaquinone biosynthesis C-methylase UbiE
MNEEYFRNTQNSYDKVSEEYTKRVYGELAGKPLDRQLLDRFAESVQALGLACDLGCGPGHVARYLHDRGVNVCGIDLSPGMIERACQLNPGIDFKQGNLMALNLPDESLGGIVAFYSIIHIPRSDIVNALRELKRTLVSRGILLIAFHIGQETVHIDAWWDNKVSLDFAFFQSDEMTNYLRTAGFEIEEVIERDPYSPDVEHQSRRAYIFSRKPAPKGS